MAQHIETGRSVHGRGHSAGVQRVTDTEGGLEGAVSDSGFCFLGDEVEDCGAGRFGAGTGGGRDGDEGEEGLGYGEAFAEGSVDEVEEVSGREAGVEVHQLGSVDYLEHLRRLKSR